MPTIKKYNTMPPEEVTREWLLEDKLKEALWVISNMRRHQEYWHKHYGALNRDAMKRWEKKADDFVLAMGIEDGTDIKKLKIFEDDARKED